MNGKVQDGTFIRDLVWVLGMGWMWGDVMMWIDARSHSQACIGGEGSGKFLTPADYFL